MNLMKDNPDKNIDDIIKTSEGDFHKDSLFYLNEIESNKVEGLDVLMDIEREYLANLAEKNPSQAEINRVKYFFYLFNKLFLTFFKRKRNR